MSYHAGTEPIVAGMSATGGDRTRPALLAVSGFARVRVLYGVARLFDELGAGAAAGRPAAVDGRRRTSGASVVRSGASGCRSSTLNARDAFGLERWFGRRGYSMQLGAVPLLRGYLREGWRLVVIRPAAGGSGELPPFAISFRTNRIVYPMRLAALDSRPVSLDLFVNADWPASASGVPLRLPDHKTLTKTRYRYRKCIIGR